MPGAGQVVGEHPGEVEAEEAVVLGVVVRGGPAEQCLGQEQGGDREEEPCGGPLGRGERHLFRRNELEPPLLHPLPTEQVRIPAP